MTKRAIIYIRQSKARDDSISIEIQETSARAYCSAKGYDVADVVVDEGVSGFRDWKKRPNFPRVLKQIESSAADLVVVYRWSRLSRRRADQHVLIELLGTVESAAESIDISTAGGRVGRDVMMMIAAFESDLKSEQWKEALDRRAAAGLPKNGLLRYGYKSQGKGLPLVPDETTAPILREMYQRYTAGAGYQSLVRDLNRRGITTRQGKVWGVHSLIRMLDSGFGAGLLCEGKSMVFADGAHEAVITKDEWTAYLDARESRRGLPSKRKNPRWPFAGLVVCGLCGRSVSVNTFTEPKSQVRCTGYVNNRTCSGVWMNRVQLEFVIESFLAGWQETAMTAVVSAQRSEGLDRARNHAETVERDLDAAQTSLTRLAVAFARGALDERAHADAEKELVADRDRLAGELTAARQDVARLVPAEQVNIFPEPGDPITSGELNQQLSRVLRSVQVFPDRILITPLVGDTATFGRTRAVRDDVGSQPDVQSLRNMVR